MAAKLTRLTHKIVIQLLLMAESSIICSSLSLQAVSLETFGYTLVHYTQSEFYELLIKIDDMKCVSFV
jgi:hypothetical protein